MKSLIMDLFGSYVPNTYLTYEYYGGSYHQVEVIPAGAAGVDWSFVAGVLLFAVVLIAFFRCLRMVMNHG